jgi:multidrug efflux system membrane fusion protein
MTSKRMKFAAILALPLIGLIWFALSREPAAAADKTAPSAADKAIVVDTAEVKQADVPIYFQGLGTVQAFYTVTVTARIDGELQEIYFTEGQTVKKGDLLALIDPRPARAALEQAVATKAKDAAQLENAKRDLTRYAALQPEDLASKQTVDTARANVDQLAAQLQVDQAQIDSARTQLDYTRITSPITGRTGIRGVDPGNIVHASDTTGIVVVTQVQPISVIFTLPEEDLSTVAAGLAAGPVQVSTLERETAKVLDTGNLSLVDNQIVQATGSAKFKAVFKNEHNTLWPGQFVNARVLVRSERNALIVPPTAVQLGPNGPYTYVVKEDSTVEVRPITLGQESNGATIVTSGLKLHDHVVTTNQYRLQAGTHVRTGGAAAAAAKPS